MHRSKLCQIDWMSRLTNGKRPGRGSEGGVMGQYDQEDDPYYNRDEANLLVGTHELRLCVVPRKGLEISSQLIMPAPGRGRPSAGHEMRRVMGRRSRFSAALRSSLPLVSFFPSLSHPVLDAVDHENRE
jgi:hypothetical protein